MSVFTDMRPAILKENIPKKSTSGAELDNYVYVSDIDIAIYKNDVFKIVATTAYKESTHNAVTYYKAFKDGKQYRIEQESTIYEVNSFNTSCKQTVLLLKAINYGR